MKTYKKIAIMLLAVLLVVFGGLAAIAKNLDRELAKNKISADDKQATLQRISATTDRQKIADCDLVVEAATEKFEIKAEIFRDLDRITKPEVILASNTSSISITKIAALTIRDAKGNASRVTIQNVFQSNGVIHVIDSVLLPS